MSNATKKNLCASNVVPTGLLVVHWSTHHKLRTWQAFESLRGLTFPDDKKWLAFENSISHSNNSQSQSNLSQVVATRNNQLINFNFLFLAIEQGQLARENLSLRHAVDECHQHRRITERAYFEFCRHLQDDPLTSETIALQRDEGWYVHFPDNSPSFYFQPLSQSEFDISRDLHVNTSPCVATVGNIFGWTVDYAPVNQNESDSAFMAHARFSRQVRCTLDDAATILPRTDTNSWPVVVAARSWGLEQSGRHCCVELQQLDYSCRVAVCNIPGDINLRYIAALRHSRDAQSNGKRVDTYSLTITDSKKNALLREMEGQQQNVQWILNGGCIATFTEVDDTTINIVYDHWAGCISEVHGHDLYIDWVQHAVRLEHIISPARMLHN